MIEILPEIRTALDDRLNNLAIGPADAASRAALDALARQLPGKATQRDFALACVAGLWLLHDFFDESHHISQDLDTTEGSYWHAILHRREPDYGNAKYWFRRVPRHPIFNDLRRDAATLTGEAGVPAGSEFLTTQKTWDAAAFVDLCEKGAGGSDALALLCRRIQRREWDLLFAYCHEQAFA